MQRNGDRMYTLSVSLSYEILQEDSHYEKGNGVESEVWADRAIFLVSLINWVTGYIADSASFVDLTGTDMLENEEEKEENERREKQMRMRGSFSSSNGSRKSGDDDMLMSRESDDGDDEDDEEEGEIAALLKKAKEKRKVPERVQNRQKQRVLPAEVFDSEQEGEAEAFNDGFAVTKNSDHAGTTAAGNTPAAAPARARNSLFARKNLASLAKPKVSVAKEAESPIAEEEDQWGAYGQEKKKKKGSKKKRASQKPSTGKSGDPSGVEDEVEEQTDGARGDGEEEGSDGEDDEDDDASAMSKAKMLQQKKKSTKGPVIAKKLTAKERRALELTGGKKSKFLMQLPNHRLCLYLV